MASSNVGPASTAATDASEGEHLTSDAASPAVTPSVPFPIVGFGASAGGLEPFAEILRALPTDTGMAFVLVQHLDPTHASMLSEIMGKTTSMPVAEAREGMAVEGNHVYVIPPGANMVLDAGTLRLSPRTEKRGLFRPIDVFLRSLAQQQGYKAIGVILSGGATDGTLGLEEIKAEGGITFAQDDTAQQDSMPRSAIAAGVVDFVLPPNEIADELARISQHPYVAPSQDAEPKAEPTITKVLDLIRHVTGVDFTNYKRATLVRRITRRMVLHRLHGLKDYIRMLQGTPAEIDALFQDILISVTSFFRNPEGIELLKTEVFPTLVKDRSRVEPVRVWVLGCSTGEEAYSVAIAFTEYCESVGRQHPLQLFASDLNGVGVERARQGIYPKTIAQDVSADRLRRYFTEIGGNYRVSKAIRDLVIFARHNVLTDPPFSHIDLITCRNLLIYLDPTLQQRVMPILHYALRPGGYLWLGSSETVGGHRDLFDIVEAKQKLYRCNPGSAPTRHFGIPIAAREREAQPVFPTGPFKATPSLVETQREADRIVVSSYGPPGVLVNAEHEIVQFRGDTGAYLAPAPGRASLNLLKMLRDGLLVGVRAALLKAKRERAPARVNNLRVKSNGGSRKCNVSIIPLPSPSNELSYLVLFEDALSPSRRAKPETNAASLGDEETDTELTRVNQELASTREYLQSVIEQQEATNEELQSANEEVQSANEELLSINEELQTSKEEIQSSNEELATVNDELHNRNLELSQINNDLLNLFGSVPIAIVMLGSDLRVRRFTPMAEKMLNLIAADVGRPIGDLKLTIDVPDLEHQVLDVIDSVSAREQEVRDRHGRWHMLRIRPYKTAENRIDGAVLVLVDIDSLKRNAELLKRQANLLDQALEPIFAWEFSGRITYWNRAAEDTYGYTREQALGAFVHELLQTSMRTVAAVREALQKDGTWTGELTQVRRDGEPIVVETRMVLVRESDNQSFVLEATRPITERKRMEHELIERAEALTQADRRKNEFLAILAHELRNPLAPLSNAMRIVREPTASGEMRDHSLDMIERQMRRLTQLVDDLLDVSRIEHGKITLRLEPVELRTFVESVADDARGMLDSRGQRLELAVPNEPVYVAADQTRMAQVFGNLLSNASKYSDTGSRIQMAVAVSPARDSEPQQVTVSVQDHGLGIAVENLPRIFELFAQEDRSISRSTGGLGIGLTLAKTLVHLHGGEIEARSEGRGTGSEFRVTLNVLRDVPAQLPRPEHVTPADVAAVSRRVLVVDDNNDAADSLAEVLRLVGHEVDVAYNGVTALLKAESFAPDVVVLDLALPTMDGFEIARRIRRLRGSKARLIAVTGFGQDDDRRTTQDAGFDHHITKPPELDLLFRLIAAPGVQ